jgi:lipooligosaccharide transport system permease protein
LGEMIWAASKATLSGMAILVVATLLGVTRGGAMLWWIVPLIPLIGLSFAGLSLVVTAYAKGYDFFSYYFTIVITPMLFLSGVFFPISQLPQPVQLVAHLFPLAHAVALVRPLMLGEIPSSLLLHLGVLIAYALIGYVVAVRIFRRRLLR